MRLVLVRLAELRGIGRDQRQVARIGEIDQRGLGRLLDCVAAPCQFDVEPGREQRFQPREQRLGMGVLPLG